MKKILFSLIAVFGSYTASAQTYFTAGFDNGINDWTLIDADGDGYNWGVTNSENGSVLNSASYDNDAAVVLFPDNWIVSPAIDLAFGISPTLYWEAIAVDQSWANENYTVYVSTQSDVTSLESSAVSFNEIIGTTDGYAYRNLDVSSIREVGKRWFYDDMDNFKKHGNHRALGDIRDSIEELKYYRKTIFKL